MFISKKRKILSFPKWLKVLEQTEFYTPLEEAKEEIWKRWRDMELRRKVQDFIGNILQPLQDAPKAVLVRNIATPDFEFFHFLELSWKADLSPLFGEYINDKFVTNNVDKLALAKMPFYKGRNGNSGGGVKFAYRKVIDFSNYECKLFRDIQTLWGENFVNFHHRLLSQTPFEVNLVDISTWFKSNGGNAKGYYQKYLALFICNGILFENFITNEDEEEFSRTVVYPAFKAVETHFGVKPLIVPIAPHDTACDIYWRCYPPYLEEIVLKSLAQTQSKQSSKL